MPDANSVLLLAAIAAVAAAVAVVAVDATAAVATVGQCKPTLILTPYQS